MLSNSIAVYRTRLALLSSFDWKSKTHPQYGPVHKHGEKLFLQVQVAERQWVAINVLDLTEVYLDPGWFGDVFGWAVIEREDCYRLLSSASNLPTVLGPPCRKNGKPITYDDFLLCSEKTLKKYFNQTDPLSHAMDSVQIK